MSAADFQTAITGGYSYEGPSILLGKAVLNGEVHKDLSIRVPLKTMNRHGLISGATGTGKTKTLQGISEELSKAGVPVLLLDIKGDLSGIAAPSAMGKHVSERVLTLGLEDYQPMGFPAELFTLSNQPGAKLRATVSEFGPVLLAKILELNDTQESILAMLFKYCDDHQLPLLDLQDLSKTLQWAANEGKAELSQAYGNISTASVGTIMRRIIELQQQGADNFFGERSFDIDDLMRLSEDGRGMLSILRVSDLQSKPKLFSTFMLQMLAELYASLPEEGDLESPKLIMFIDEAHLIFKDANSALIEQLETIIKLIRSKGVGIFFCTQNPIDIAPSVLSQLGLKIQHALRAFTANDRKAIKQAAENYPSTEFYNTDELITQLGIGEALVTSLNEKGIPTPLVHTMLCPPRSRMDVLTDAEVTAIVSKSQLVPKYNEVVNRESAYEILNQKLTVAAQPQPAAAPKAEPAQSTGGSLLESIASNSIVKSMLRTAGNQIVRSLLGSIGVSGSRRRKSSSWF